MRLTAVLALACLLALAFAGCSGKGGDGDGTSTTSSSSQSTTSATNSTTPKPVAPPTANLTASPASGTAPLNVTLSLSGNVSAGNLTWTLLYGDGNRTNGTSLPATLVHQYTGGGNFTPTLTVSDGLRNSTANVTLRIDPGAVGFAPGLDPACQRPDAVGNEAGGWVDDRGGGSVWVYQESNDIPGLQVSMEPSPVPAPVGGHTDSLAVEHNCLNGDTMMF